ncbi:unnamed protein product [Pieris macdunnoughi]|uniref:Uncharacterized protein n=1 Tax=Pieris macdunnoughi TaxID=345717 RepID=A0A821W8K4_9NEOP|nr:unnamed protein product [Pieris macdunnoughi]
MSFLPAWEALMVKDMGRPTVPGDMSVTETRAALYAVTRNGLPSTCPPIAPARTFDKIISLKRDKCFLCWKSQAGIQFYMGEGDICWIMEIIIYITLHMKLAKPWEI